MKPHLLTRRSPRSPWPRGATVLVLRRRSCVSERPTSSLSLNRPFLLRRTRCGGASPPRLEQPICVACVLAAGGFWNRRRDPCSRRRDRYHRGRGGRICCLGRVV